MLCPIDTDDLALRNHSEALGSLGTIGVVGAPPLGTTAAFDINNLLLGGRTIRGIVEGDSDLHHFIPELVALHRAGKFPFDQLVTRYPLAEINEAVAAQARGVGAQGPS